MRCLTTVIFCFLVAACCIWPLMCYADQSDKDKPAAARMYPHISANVRAAATGNPNCVRIYTDSIVETFVHEPQAASCLKGKLHQLEMEHRQGNRRAITESDLVRAINEFVDRSNGPDFAKASSIQIRQTRVTMVSLCPGVVGGDLQHPGRAASGRLSIPTEMSPAEAAFVLGVFVQQKLTSEFHQVTPAEYDARYAQLHRTRPAPPAQTQPILQQRVKSGRENKLREWLERYAETHSSISDVQSELDLFLKAVGYGN